MRRTVGFPDRTEGTPGSPSSSRASSHRRRGPAAVAALALVTGALLTPSVAQAAAPVISAQTPTASSGAHSTADSGKKSARPLCATTVAPDQARCFAMVLETGGVQPHSTEPTGLSPADIRSAYKLPEGGGAGRTIGIVVAYDAPTAEADLVHYRQQFGLPALATGQFKKVSQRGGTDYPQPDAGWAGEAALDIDAITAAAPAANIVLVVADDPSFENLGIAVNQAVAQGAEIVNNSYGTSYTSTPGSGEDDSLLPINEEYYNHPGVAILASSGDSDYGVSFPASSNYVTAIGGTSLVKDTGNARGWSESVWHNSYGGPGSGCSITFDKVAGQQVTGCDKRSVADVSAVADPETGLSVYYTYGGGQWSQYGGTSLSSPLIAGMHAIAGKPTADTYPNTYPYLKPDAFFDVTTGNNGTCSPSILCTAGVGYDGPTGLGTPNGVAGFRATETGTVSGTVTTAGGAPLPGATVAIGDAATVTTGTDGTYNAQVEPGTYSVTFAAYGYKSVTKTGVVVTLDTPATVNAQLTAVPSRAVSGTVKDGSGHGYPLYSMITIDGAPGGPVYTDPFDGSYSVNLPQGQTFTLTFTPMIPGYLPVSKTVKIGSSDRSISIAAKVDPAVENVPGYTTKLSGTVQGFDGTTAPAGWTVQDKKDPGWTFTDVGKRGNLTGGTGGFAIIDSDKSGTGKTQDSYLVSPNFNIAGKTNAVLEFDSFFKSYSTSNGTVELSSDGGSTWKTVYDLKSKAQSGHVRVAIPAADATATVQVRFHYTGSYAYYWEVDNVFVGTRSVVPVSGGLLAGLVKDGNTGDFVGGATVTSVEKPELTATTGPTGDPAVGDGYYWMFSPLTGAHAFTVAKGGYGTTTVTPNIRANLLTRADATLAAGQVGVSATEISKTVKMGSTATASFTLINTGTLPAKVKLGESDGGFVLQSVGGAPLQKVPARVYAGSAKAEAAAARSAGRTASAAQSPVGPSADAWAPVTDLPTILQDSSAVFDGTTLWSVGGYNGSDDISTLYAYDPQAATWSTRAAAADAREAGAIASMNGKLVWTGGWGPTGSADGKTEIYDPASDAWSTGAANPKPQAAAGKAVIGSKLYLVGGCDAACGSTTVQVYDAAANTWSSGPAYPQSTSWIGCGGIAEKVYCAGGYNGSASSTKTYVLDPAAGTWSPAADLPADLWASFSTAANGKLLIAGGVAEGSTVITNAGYAFDPAAGSWSPLPNLNTALYRGSGAVGFYAVGGNSGGSTTPPSKTVQLLAGYDQGGTSDVPWLTVDPTEITLAAGASAKVTVTLDASDPSVAQPGDYSAAITIATDTPYPVASVPVTMTVTPPKTWGKIAGTVTSGGAPVAGATVEMDGFGGSYTLTTDAQGKYAYWLDKRNNPLTVIVAKDGYKPQTATLKVVAGQTVTKNWVLVKK